MNKTILNYGIAGGLICTLLFLSPVVFSPEQYFNQDSFLSSEIVGYSIMVLSMLPVYLGTRSLRNSRTNESFGFGRALGAALLITTIATVIFYLGNVLVYEVLAPDFLMDFSTFYRESLINSAPDEATKQARIAELDSWHPFFTNSYLYALLMAVTVFFIGIIISLISAMILRRSPEPVKKYDE